MTSGGATPDVVGLTLDDARQAVLAAGWRVEEVVETRSPRRPLLEPRRVVRQRVIGAGRLALVVCGERSADAQV